MSSPVELVISEELLGIIWESIRRYTVDKQIQSDEKFTKTVSELMNDSSKGIRVGSNMYPSTPLILTPMSESKTDSKSSIKENLSTEKKLITSNTVMIYTDGACSGSRGPGGCAARVIFDDGKIIEESKSLPSTTNNIAELKAVELGLNLFLNSLALPVKPITSINILTDSQYVIGVLDKNWKAKANVELIASISELITKTRSNYTIIFTKVEGHSGNPNNERVDYLATHAIPRS